MPFQLVPEQIFKGVAAGLRNMVEAHVLGAEVVLARAHDDGREGEGAAHGVCATA